MRLIDADKFKELFYTDTAIGKIMRLMIDEQPTAYDVDKVVERLEEKILNTSDTQIGISAKMAFGKSIEIVKSGGIE